MPSPKRRSAPDVTPAEADEMVDNDALLLDLREAEEWHAGRIALATHVRLADLTGSFGVGGDVAAHHP